MKLYSDKISLEKNSRGVYCIDTSIGCKSGMDANDGGCYNDCYSAKSAKIYGYDFQTTVLRRFKNESHKQQIINKISKVKMPFIRIGASGDPSENWEHTIDILKVISYCNIEIIIITRHWNLLSIDQLNYLSTLNICINTSVSAMDSIEVIDKQVKEYNRIKKYCKSVLRVISCDFNLQNEPGRKLADIQKRLFENENTLDTVFRPSKQNKLVLNNVINTKEEIFNGNKQLASKLNRKTYMGKCASCKEMCGVNITTNYIYENKKQLLKQLRLFK